MPDVKNFNKNEFKDLLLQIEQDHTYVGVYKINVTPEYTIDAYKVSVNEVSYYLFKDMDKHSTGYSAIPCDRMIHPVNFSHNVRPSIEVESDVLLHARKRATLIGALSAQLNLNPASTLRFLDVASHPRIDRMLLELEALQGGQLNLSRICDFTPAEHESDASHIYKALDEATYRLRYGHDIVVQLDAEQLAVLVTRLSPHGRGNVDRVAISLKSHDALGVGFDEDVIPYEFDYRIKQPSSNIEDLTVFQNGRPVPLANSPYADLYGVLKEIQIAEVDGDHRFAQRPEFCQGDGLDKLRGLIVNRLEESGMSLKIGKALEPFRMFVVAKSAGLSM
ncbi:MAG: hypothetical protein RSD49_08380 [Hafnia sp.]